MMSLLCMFNNEVVDVVRVTQCNGMQRDKVRCCPHPWHTLNQYQQYQRSARRIHDRPNVWLFPISKITQPRQKHINRHTLNIRPCSFTSFHSHSRSLYTFPDTSPSHRTPSNPLWNIKNYKPWTKASSRNCRLHALLHSETALYLHLEWSCRVRTDLGGWVPVVGVRRW